MNELLSSRLNTIAFSSNFAVKLNPEGIGGYCGRKGFRLHLLEGQVFECWEVEEDEVPTVDKLLGSSYYVSYTATQLSQLLS